MSKDTSAAMLVYFTLGDAYYYKLQTLAQIDTLTPKEINSMMDSAIRYNGNALDCFLILQARNKILYPEAWLTNIYNVYGCFYQAKNDSRATDYFLKALEKSRSIEDTNSRNFLEGLMYENLADHNYFTMKHREKGYQYSKKAIELLKKSRSDIYANALLTLGQIEMNQGRIRFAEKYLLQALRVSDTFLLKIDGIIDPVDPTFRLWGVTQAHSMRAIMFRSFVRMYELKGDFRNALLYQKKLEKEKDIQSLDELTSQIIGLEANNEDQLKRQEIAGLVRDNELRRMRMNQTRILFAGLGGVVLIAFLVFVVWIQRKRFRSDQKALILEQKLLRSQMNPHFIFNSLSSIQNFIVTEKPDKASLYLSKFSRLVRNILDNSLEEYVVLEKEINTIENYMELQKIRFIGKFDYRIHIADEIDAEALKIPPMLAQPFIENAIEHGIKHRQTPGHIDIRFSVKDHILIFEVEDDGIGRQKAREIAILKDPEHKSMATSLTRERLANLNQKLNEKIRLEILDLKNTLGEATGTRVTFGIPLSIE